jgi:hypothetical protein
VPSKRRSNTSKNAPPEPRFLLDRNLGRYELKAQLSKEGIDVTIHDDVFKNPEERDPWIFYWAGKNGYVLVTADLSFKNLFPHQAGIALGRTPVFSFTGSTFNSAKRGEAFLKARNKIQRLLIKQPWPFIATIRLDGEVHLDEPHPAPSRKSIDGRDWESYERVCKAEGIDQEAVPGSAFLRGSSDGPVEDQAGVEASEEKADGAEAGQ